LAIAEIRAAAAVRPSNACRTVIFIFIAVSAVPGER
jgi:hypothetical protein